MQEANFAKNRLKETIENSSDFENLRKIVEKLQQVILLKQKTDLTESEQILYKTLFSGTQPATPEVKRETFTHGDADHNERSLNQLMPLKSKFQPQEGDEDLLQML